MGQNQFDDNSYVKEEDDPSQQAKRKARNKRARANRKLRDELMRDCCMTKGKDSMGRTIWE